MKVSPIEVKKNVFVLIKSQNNIVETQDKFYRFSHYTWTLSYEADPSLQTGCLRDMLYILCLFWTVVRARIFVYSAYIDHSVGLPLTCSIFHTTVQRFKSVKLPDWVFDPGNYRNIVNIRTYIDKVCSS